MESTLEYPCPICNSEEGLTLSVHTSEIAYFGEHTEMTIICNQCGWRNTDFIPSEGKKPSVWSLIIDKSELMTTRVVRSSSCTVRIVELGGSSIDLMIVAYADPMGFAAFNEVKENLIFNIMKIVKSNKSEFAYPSTSLYVESMPK